MLMTTIKAITWETVNPALLKILGGKIYEWRPEWQGLNLGCGLDVLDGWVGIDGGISVLFRRLPSFVLRLLFRWFNMSDFYSYADYSRKLKSSYVIYHDLHYGIPFKTETCPFIYSSHFLEHLSPLEAKKLAKECYRVLQCGGGIRIAVPSLEYEVSKMQLALNQYEKGNSQPVMEYFTSRPGYTNRYSVHRYMYDYVELQRLLASVGFVNIEECAYKTGKMKDCEKLDTRENSLFVEAWKI
jgi:predicted SAM-dependent methyltransferase